MKKLIVIFLLLISPVVFAGDYTSNEYFYLPSKSAYGTAERNLWLASLEATDAVIANLVSSLGGVTIINGWAVDGTAVRLADAAYNVGMGTTSPISGLMLDVRGKSYFSQNVGIGTFDAQHTLEVAGTINATNVQINGTDVCLYGTDCGLATAGGWTDGGTTIYTTNTADNVGIGTTTATTALHVNGGVTVDGLNSGWLFESGQFIDGDDTNKICFSQTGGTNNERSCVDHETVANTKTWSTSTGITAETVPWSYQANALKSATSLNVGASYYTAQTPPTNGVLIQGNVGIGTFNPGSYALKVNGNVFATQYETTPSNTPQSQFSPILAGDTHWGIGMNSDGDGTNNDRLFVFEGTDVTASHRMAIMPGGNVGIGTDSPVSALQVNGTATATAFVGDGSGLTNVGGAETGWSDGGTNVYTTTTTDTVGIGTTTPNTTTLEIVKQLSTSPFKVSSTATGNGDLMVMRSGGNVGIGTYEPSQKLEVSGSINVSGSDIANSLKINNMWNAFYSNLTNPGGSGSLDYLIFRPQTSNSTMRFALFPNGTVGGTANSMIAGFKIFQNDTSTNLTDSCDFGMYMTSSGMRFNTKYNGTCSPFPIQFGRQDTTVDMTIDTSGNVGLGTIYSTSGKMTILQSTDSSTGGFVVSNGAITSTARLWASSGSDGARLDGGSSATLPVSFNGSGTGNVGIGTFKPSSLFDVNRKFNVLSGGGVGIGTTAPVGGTAIMNGNVGIGTWSPTQKMEIKDASATGTNLRVQNTNTAGLGQFQVYNSDGNGFAMVATGSGYAVPNTYGPLVTAGEKLSFGESDGTINMTIDGNGNVGIGTVNPTGQFAISNAAAQAGQATCWTTAGRIGYCTSVVGVGGGCTCTGL